MRKLLLLCAIVGFFAQARAQTVPATANLTASDSGTCATAGACLTVRLPTNTASSVVQLTGTFSATVQFEGTTSVGGTFVAVNAVPVGGSTAVTSATSTGAWRIAVAGLAQIRVRCSTFSSGPVVVAITSSAGSSANNTSSGGGGGSGTVTSVDQSVPSWLTVSGNPVTTSGTLAIAPTAAQTSHQVIGTCNAATTFAPCALVFGDLPVITLNNIADPTAAKSFSLGANTPAAFNAPGVFTNTTPGVNGPNLLASINSCNPSTEWLVFNRAGTADTEGITGCATIGSGSTATQATGVVGYANNSSTTTNAVGGYFQGVCTATGVKCWGVNGLVESISGHAATFMQHEFDVNVNNSGDIGTGIEVTGAWAAQPTQSVTTYGNMPAFLVNNTNSSNKWTSGFACAAGVTDNSTGNGNCIDIGATGTGAGNASQAIVFHSRTSPGNAIITGELFQGVVSSAPDFLYVPQASGFGTFVALLGVHGSASGAYSGQIISSGTVAISSSTTATTNFTQSYGSAPNCTVTPTSDPTAVGVYWVTPGTSGITVTVKVSGTVTFDYLCIPAAN